MAVRRNPLFQNALLQKQAEGVATGRALTDTSDISGAVAGREAQMQSAFKDIALGQKGRAESKRQFQQNLRLRRKDIESSEEELPWRIGLGLATSGLAAYQGYENKQEMQRQASEQRLQTASLNSFIEEQARQRRMLMLSRTYGR